LAFTIDICIEHFGSDRKYQEKYLEVSRNSVLEV